MKIAMLSHVASRGAPTGAEKSLALAAAGLSRRGHRIVITAPGPWLPGAELASLGIVVTRIPVRPCWLVQYGRQPLPMQMLRLARFLWPDPGRRQLASWLGTQRPDVVLVNCLPHVRGAAAARSVGLPVVWYVREILAPGPRRRWFAARLRENADRVVAVSQAVSEWLTEEGLGDRVSVVHNGVRPPSHLDLDPVAVRRDLGLPEAGIVAGYLGQLSRHKGAEDAIAAVERATACGLEIDLMLAGPGRKEDLARVRARLATSPISSRLHLVEARPDVWPLLAAVDLVMVPTRWPDPLPRVVMEAMAARIAVVGSDSGGIPEMILDGETGLVVATGDIEALSTALGVLADDPVLRDRLAAAAEVRARECFSVQVHVARLERVLQEAVAGSSGSMDGMSELPTQPPLR